MNNTDYKEIEVICQQASGDTLIVCGFKDAFEEYYHGKTIFVIKPEHEFILKMYGYDNYKIKEYSYDELCELKRNKSDNYIVAHPDYLNDEKKLLNEYKNFKFSCLDLFKKTLGLPENAAFKKPTNPPLISKELSEKIKHILPLEKTVLLLPESFSLNKTGTYFFEYYAKYFCENGYKVVTLAKNKENIIKGTEYIFLSLEESLAVALECAHVFCSRSGVADIIAQFSNNLTVFYPGIYEYELSNLNKTFSVNVREVICANKGLILSKVFPLFQKLKRFDDSEVFYQFSIGLFRKKVRPDCIKYLFLGIPVLKIKFDFLKKLKKYCLFSYIFLKQEKMR